MKKLRGRFWATCLAVIIVITSMPMDTLAVGKDEVYSYTVFAEKDISFTGNTLNVNGNIHSNRAIMYQCMNGSVNGTSSSSTVSYGANSHVSARNELTGQEQQAVPKLGIKLMDIYFLEDTWVGVLSKTDSNVNLSRNVYSKTIVSIGGNINLNNVAIGAHNNIEIGTVKSGQSYNVNGNQAVIYTVTGDIIIDVDNFNFNGLIYAPNGEVKIVSKGNVGINGIIIAQTVTLQGCNINLQSDRTFATFVSEVINAEDTDDMPSAETKEDNSEDTTEDTSYVESSEGDSEDGTEEDIYEGNGEDSSIEVADEDDSEESSEGTSEKSSEENNYTDTDGDGLTDSIEDEIGTDSERIDTDEDGLFDFDEVYLTITDPLTKDTDNNGVNDAEEDYDEDGLKNIVEIEIGTMPSYADTDCDGLLDGEESQYSTNPVKMDTDEDGLIDGDEIGIGLNPCNPVTFGGPDAEYIVVQRIAENSDVLSTVNVDENAYSVHIDAKVSGNLSINLIADKTDYAAVIENECMVGMPIEITYNENYQVEEIILSFDIKEAYRNNELNYFSDANDTSTYSPELVGIKRLQVFKYFEDSNMLFPIETFHDTENYTVKTVVDDFGIYCLMDMEKWLLSLAEQGGEFEAQPVVMSLDAGIKGEYSFKEEETFLGVQMKETSTSIETIEEMYVDDIAENASVENVEEVIYSGPTLHSLNINKTPIDIVFLLQNAGSADYIFDCNQDNIINVSKVVFDTYPNARISVITFGIDEARFLGSDEEYWFYDTDELTKALQEIEYVDTTEYCNRGAAFDLLIEQINYRPSAVKFAYQMTNGNNKVSNNYFSQLDACKKLSIIYSEIRDPLEEYASETYGKMVAAAIEKTNGISIKSGKTSEIEIWEHIKKNVPNETVEYKAIIASGWKTITLDAPLDPNNGVDTDGDTLLDWDEVDVDNELLVWDADGSVELPTIKMCIEKEQKVYVERGLDRLLSAEGIPTNLAGKIVAKILEYKIMPINSDPTNMDSDEDELIDNKDLRPLCYDYIPSEFVKYIQCGYIEYSDLKRANDGFTICMKPLGDIMNEIGITAEGFDIITIDDVQYDEYNGMRGNEYFLSDWYLYGYDNKGKEEIYSIIKLRTCVNYVDAKPGVSVPFRELDISLLGESYTYEDLGYELNVLIYGMESEYGDESLQGYFARANNQTNYMLAEVYIDKIIEQDNVNGNNTFTVPDVVLSRVTNRLNESPDVYDVTTNLITVADISNLTLDEQQCLLVSRAGTISYNAFAAEIIAHALGAVVFTEMYIRDTEVYESCMSADLGSNEGGDHEEDLLFAYKDSIFYMPQQEVFGDY